MLHRPHAAHGFTFTLLDAPSVYNVPYPAPIHRARVVIPHAHKWRYQVGPPDETPPGGI
ncbi:hypothetical protein EVJ58_g9141 [Rhodofomes roseus]|uniref:Uncharacterized protein n=1 Tax=Rhodofomes roseus TaxID=34475 RepID=A0A4Y9XX51_9APHY|nr:hypothetical protein EVJ58_g9141 [Rhodofomes roseus]